jgi:phosphopantothenate-cysteine ligase/phosphopantothenoylcysteine decarboxylase/phosphopantothenate--cysteine ligase
MNYLVTAGTTASPIDSARAVVASAPVNFGPVLARTAAARGHKVTLLSSDPDGAGPGGEAVTVVPFRTVGELAAQFEQLVTGGSFDAVCHAAAVGPFQVAGTFTPDSGTEFNTRTRQWDTVDPVATLREYPGRTDGESALEIWVRMTRAPNLIDRVRSQWEFPGLIVKFKTTTGTDDRKLVEEAEVSRLKSSADLIVLNTWETARQWAYFGPVDGRYDRLPRREVADRVVLSVEHVTRQARNSAEFGPARKTGE